MNAKRMGFMASLAIAFALGVLAPVQAAAKNAPLDPCGSHADFNRRELDNLGRWLLKTSTVEAVPLAETVRFEMTKDVTNFGPFVEPGQKGFVIYIPEGFLALQCRLVVATWVMEGGAEDLKEPIHRDFDACDRTGETLYTCLQRSLDAAWSQILLRGDTKPGRLEFIGSIADDAFNALLLDEFAHVALRHDFSAPTANKARAQEFDADVYASTIQAIIDGQPFATPYNFMLLGEFLDGAYASHDSIACRKENSRVVSDNIAMLSTMIVTFPTLGRFSDETVRTRRSMLTDLAHARGDAEFEISGRSEPCSHRNMSGITAFRRDLRDLAIFQDNWVDRLPDPNTMTESASFLRALLNTPMQSSQGKMTLSYIFSLYLASYTRDAPELAYDDIMRDGIAGIRKNYFLSKDYGRVAGLLGANMFHRLPKTRPANENNAEIHRLLNLAHRYNPDFIEAFTVHGLLYFREGDCAAAAVQFRGEQALLTGKEAEETGELVRALENDVRRGVCGPKR